jgi:hypothetical protein
MRIRRAFVGTLLAAAAVGLSGIGCSELHRPTAVVPDRSHLSPSYATPESCLRYMRIGIERKDDSGQDAYLGTLADTSTDDLGFHAFFDPAVLNAYSGIPPTDWDLQHEAQFLAVFIRSYADPYEMNWLPDEVYPYDDTPDADHMILHRRYEVRAVRPSTSDTLLIAVGYADLYFARLSASRWALYRWQDRVAPEVGPLPIDPVQRTFGSRRLDAGAGG